MPQKPHEKIGENHKTANLTLPHLKEGFVNFRGRGVFLNSLFFLTNVLKEKVVKS